jgi:hypothetical protein
MRGNGLTPAEFKKELAAVPLPSPHDDPFTHSVVHMLSRQIEEACGELGIPLRSGVAYGSNASLDVSAGKYGVHFTKASVVTLSVGFITFCSSVSQMFALSLPHERDGDRLMVSFAPGPVLARIDSDTKLRRYWGKVIADYACGSGPLSVGNRLVPEPASFTRMQILFSMERFALAHEYGHHVGQHGSLMAAEAGSKAGHLAQEFEADLFALSIDRYVGMRDPRPNPFAASGAAAVLLLKSHDCVRRVRQILRAGNDEIQSDGVHPDTADRIAAFDSLDEQFSEPQRSNLRKMRNDCAEIVEEMYARLKPSFLEKHKRGLRSSVPGQRFDPPHALL